MDMHSLPPADPDPQAAIDSAVALLCRVVERQRGGDENYLAKQLPRYRRTLARLLEIHPPPCRVLDIGSHYLHQSVLLSALGYRVTGIDIGLFTEPAFVRERARIFDVHNITVNTLEAGDFLPGQEGRFELIVFTEILEHITFNPIRLWRRIYELLAPSGQVFLSTPNSMRPAAIARQLIAIATFRGVGISLDDIMDNVTYGHHWKEYSAWELKRYFALLSSDFDVHTCWYSSDLHGAPGIRYKLKRLLATVPCLRSDIEAVIQRRGTAGFLAKPPLLGMQATPAAVDIAVPAAARSPLRTREHA